MKRLGLCSFLFVVCALTNAAADSITLVFDEMATCTPPPFVVPSASTCSVSIIPPLGTIVLQDGIVNQFFGNPIRFPVSLLGVRYTINTTVPMFSWGLAVDTITHLSNFYIVDGVPEIACCSPGDAVGLGGEYFQFATAYPLGLFNGHLGGLPTGGWQQSAQIDVFNSGAAPLTLADVLAPPLPLDVSTSVYSGEPLIQVPFATTAAPLPFLGTSEVFYGATVPEPPSAILLLSELGIAAGFMKRHSLRKSIARVLSKTSSSTLVGG
jgi:hypothetical protein